MKGLMSVPEVAAALHVDPKSVRVLLDSGKLPHIRIPSPAGGEKKIRRVDPDVLAAFIKENTVAA